MARRFYFTAMTKDDEPYECAMNDHCGNIRGARTKAQKYANENNVTVYINNFHPDEIVDVIEPDIVSEEVETTEVCPYCEAEVTLNHNISDGYKTVCPECGNRLMLCDLCQHRDGEIDENGYIISQCDCDYNSQTDSCRFNPQRKERAG